jgi:hypothetical protein
MASDLPTARVGVSCAAWLAVTVVSREAAVTAVRSHRGGMRCNVYMKPFLGMAGGGV